jgi:hypothetical protein
VTRRWGWKGACRAASKYLTALMGSAFLTRQAVGLRKVCDTHSEEYIARKEGKILLAYSVTHLVCITSKYLLVMHTR